MRGYRLAPTRNLLNLRATVTVTWLWTYSPKLVGPTISVNYLNSWKFKFFEIIFPGIVRISEYLKQA